MEDQARAEAQQDTAEVFSEETGVDVRLLNKRLADANKGLEVQKQDGNWDYDPYMHGMLNGMEYVLATIEGREADFRDGPAKWRTQDLSEFVEDLAKNGTGFELKPSMQSREIDGAHYYHRDGVSAYVQRIDETIRERALAALTFEPLEPEKVVAPESDFVDDTELGSSACPDEDLIITPIPDDATDSEIDAAIAEHKAKMADAETPTAGGKPVLKMVDLGDGTHVQVYDDGISFMEGSEIVNLTHREIHMLLEKVFGFVPDDADPYKDASGSDV